MKLKHFYIKVGLCHFIQFYLNIFYLEITNSCSLPKDKYALVIQKVTECHQNIFPNKWVEILQGIFQPMGLMIAEKKGKWLNGLSWYT